MTSSSVKGTKKPQSEDPQVEEQPSRSTNLTIMDGETSLPTCIFSLQPTSSPMTRSQTVVAAALSTGTFPPLCSSVSFSCTTKKIHVAYASIPYFSTSPLTFPLDLPSSIFSTTPPSITGVGHIISLKPSTTSQHSYPNNLRSRVFILPEPTELDSLPSLLRPNLP